MKQNAMTKDEQALLVALRKGEVTAERSKEYWKDDERKKLKEMHGAGEGISKMALELQRGENAVVQQLITMQMLTPSCDHRTCGRKKRKCSCPRCLELKCPHYDRKRGKCCV